MDIIIHYDMGYYVWDTCEEVPQNMATFFLTALSNG